MLNQKDQIIYNRLQSIASLVKHTLQEIQNKQSAEYIGTILKSITNDLDQAKEIYDSKEWHM